MEKNEESQRREENEGIEEWRERDKLGAFELIEGVKLWTTNMPCFLWILEWNYFRMFDCQETPRNLMTASYSLTVFSNI